MSPCSFPNRPVLTSTRHGLRPTSTWEYTITFGYWFHGGYIKLYFTLYWHSGNGVTLVSYLPIDRKSIINSSQSSCFFPDNMACVGYSGFLPPTLIPLPSLQISSYVSWFEMLSVVVYSNTLSLLSCWLQNTMYSWSVGFFIFVSRVYTGVVGLTRAFLTTARSVVKKFRDKIFWSGWRGGAIKL